MSNQLVNFYLSRGYNLDEVSQLEGENSVDNRDPLLS